MTKLLRKFKAFVNGTFVADCPRCHKHFYGNQGHREHVRMKHIENKKHIQYRYVCHRCVKECKEV